ALYAPGATGRGGLGQWLGRTPWRVSLREAPPSPDCDQIERVESEEIVRGTRVLARHLDAQAVLVGCEVVLAQLQRAGGTDSTGVEIEVPVTLLSVDGYPHRAEIRRGRRQDAQAIAAGFADLEAELDAAPIAGPAKELFAAAPHEPAEGVH